MNEIVSLIYYVFTVKANSIDYEQAEVDSYYCMKGLLHYYFQFFDSNEDKKKGGIQDCMNKVFLIIKNEDKELYDNLINKNIDKGLFLFRWLSLMLCEELPIDSTIQLWDRLFSNLSSKNYLLYFCCSMLLSIKTDIVTLSFCDCVKVLQQFPSREFNDLDFFTKYMLKYPNHQTDSSNNVSLFMSYSIPKKCKSVNAVFAK